MLKIMQRLLNTVLIKSYGYFEPCEVLGSGGLAATEFIYKVYNIKTWVKWSEGTIYL